MPLQKGNIQYVPLGENNNLRLLSMSMYSTVQYIILLEIYMSQDRVCAPEMVITPKSDILLFKKNCLFFPGDPYHGPEVEMWSLGKSHNLNG